MSTSPRSGRPRASSRETLAEAACELFLEQGYEATSVLDITTRAGVSRSSFFNYFDSKADILWAPFDERADAAAAALAMPAADPAEILGRIVEDFAPDSLALAIANSAVMDIEDELDRERAIRQLRLGRCIADLLRLQGSSASRSDVQGVAFAGALFSAIWRWALAGAGRTALAPMLTEALRSVGTGSARSGVRQLRLVVQAPQFDDALAFYRDALGLPQSDAFEADGGARVVILEAGRATIELANPAQVAFIDRVETDGGSSDRLRVALEVDDTRVAVQRLSDAGAVVEASARQTPWRSLNARLRAPADLQLTLFQELDAPD